ncbi:hypothetical protein B0H13DRAFT_2084804 [Mycena leptocephala]|nr:hypothetical protein B0H13DRAFT_2084804 [Mycena leptocephala]
MFTPAASPALVVHLRTAHRGSGYPLLAVFALLVVYTRSCAPRICVRAASAQCRVLTGGMAHDPDSTCGPPSSQRRIHGFGSCTVPGGGVFAEEHDRGWERRVFS